MTDRRTELVEKVVEKETRADDGGTVTVRKIYRPSDNGADPSQNPDANREGEEELLASPADSADYARELVSRRFDHHPPPDEETIALHEWIRGKLGELAYDLVEELPDCRERELAVQYLETAMMYANAAVAREISRRFWEDEEEPTS